MGKAIFGGRVALEQFFSNRNLAQLIMLAT